MQIDDKKIDQKIDLLRTSIMKVHEAFFTKATPFEISKRLSEVGVSTSYISGIFAVLDKIYDEIKGTVDTSEIFVEMSIRLHRYWQKEIDVKQRLSSDNTLSEITFMFSAARHFIETWYNKKILKFSQSACIQNTGPISSVDQA